MPKTNEELLQLQQEYREFSARLKELSEEELALVAGGRAIFRYPGHFHNDPPTDIYEPSIGMIIEINDEQFICNKIHAESFGLDDKKYTRIMGISFVGYTNKEKIAYISNTSLTDKEYIIVGFDLDYFN